MSPRASWKGTLKIGELTCAVGLYTAASSSERISFHMINRATGHRLRREFVDSDTRKAVERDDQVKGYEVSDGEHILLSDDEIASAVPDSDKVLGVTAFIPCDGIEDVYFDKPYYLTPADTPSVEAFGLIRDGLHKQQVAAIAQTVLFRRMRTVLIRAHDAGMIATTLNFDYEVRSATDAFDGIRKVRIDPEMLDLAQHIIKTKMGKFDPASFEDRYEAAVAELVKAKEAGKTLPKRPKEKARIISLMDALRESAKPQRKTKTQSKTTRKAG